jgi:hypothetical protein
MQPSWNPNWNLLPAAIPPISPLLLLRILPLTAGRGMRMLLRLQRSHPGAW